MTEDAQANAAFPARRQARVCLVLTSGTRLEGDWTEPRWDHTAPPTTAELIDKFHGLADPVLGRPRADAIERAVGTLPDAADLTALTGLLYHSP